MFDSVPDPERPLADDPAVCPRVVVVDADERTRESMVGILGIRGRFRVVGSAGHVAAAVALVQEHRPDVVIVDPRLPDVSGGVALIRRVRAIHPQVHVLAVGWSPDLEHTTLTAGAHCFMRKTLRPAELAAALDQCLAAPHAEHPTDASPVTDRAPGPGLIL